MQDMAKCFFALDTAAGELIKEEGLFAAIERLVGLPVPLPTSVVEAGHAENELALLRASKERAREIEKDGEALVEFLFTAAPKALKLLPPDERLVGYL
jgi:hypothetical protein